MVDELATESDVASKAYVVPFGVTEERESWKFR
jgi:hypothetical protein